MSKRTLGVAAVFVLGLAIIITVIILQKRSQFRSRATAPPLHFASAFSSTQGNNNLRYLAFVKATSTYADASWDGTSKFTFAQGEDRTFRIDQASLAPSGGANAVVRWTAPQPGAVTITGFFQRCCTEGTGTTPYTTYSVRKGTEVLFSREANDTARQEFNVAAGVLVNDAIEFWVDANNDPSFDASSFDFTISYTVAPTPTQTPPPPTPTPSPTPTPTPTSVPSPIPSPSSSPTPTQAPTPSPAPTGSGVVLNLTLVLQGIGQGGNASPRNSERDLLVELLDAQDSKVKEVSHPIAYNAQTGLFTGALYLGQVTPGTYSVKAKTAGYLKKRIANILVISAGTNSYTIAGTPQLNAGDVNGDNEMNIYDYNVFANCFEAKANSLSCGANKPNADLNNDDRVDLLDYRLLFESFAVQRGD